MRLKALRPQVGTYGSIDAGGVVEIEDDRQSADLIKTGHWAKATEADLEAARKRQATFIEGGLDSPVGPRFAHVVEAAAAAVLPPSDTVPVVQDDEAATRKVAPARGKPA